MSTETPQRVMSSRKRLMRGVLIGVVSIGTTISVTSGTAYASVNGPARPDGCAPEQGYYYSHVGTVNQADSADSVYGASGITLTVTITKGTTITGTVGGSAKVDVSAIVAGAEVAVNASVSYAKTSSLTKSFSWKSNKSNGALYVGAQDKTMDWQYGEYNGACKFIVQATGTAKLPYLVPYSWHN